MLSQCQANNAAAYAHTASRSPAAHPAATLLPAQAATSTLLIETLRLVLKKTANSNPPSQTANNKADRHSGMTPAVPTPANHSTPAHQPPAASTWKTAARASQPTTTSGHTGPISDGITLGQNAPHQHTVAGQRNTILPDSRVKQTISDQHAGIDNRPADNRPAPGAEIKPTAALPETAVTLRSASGLTLSAGAYTITPGSIVEVPASFKSYSPPPLTHQPAVAPLNDSSAHHPVVSTPAFAIPLLGPGMSYLFRRYPAVVKQQTPLVSQLPVAGIEQKKTATPLQSAASRPTANRPNLRRRTLSRLRRFKSLLAQLAAFVARVLHLPGRKEKNSR